MSASDSVFLCFSSAHPHKAGLETEGFCMRSSDYRTYDNPADRWAYERAREPRKKKQKHASNTLIVLFVVLLVILAAATLYIRQYTVTGDSMEPTLMAGDRVFYVGFVQADYGDLVIFDAGDPYGLVIKRVAGLPGDRIEITADGHLIRNGEAVEEGYMVPDAYGNSAMAEVTVESGKLFVLGDNRAKSIDSRDVRVGQVSIDSVRGIVTRMLRNTVPADAE
ncbi:MAG TPA: signal peptidase I [Clostridia bacterium]|nr:signal peptidase I [Clostridia bacterium]